MGALLIGGAGFFAGTMYQKGVSLRNTNLVGRMGGNVLGRGGVNTAPGAQRAGMMGAKPVVGEIMAKDATSVTVKLSDGTSRIVLITGTTQLNKAEQVDAASLTPGQTVRVFGTLNADGSVTAQDIQLNPQQAQQRLGQ
jgi:hypothetical protein